MCNRSEGKRKKKKKNKKKKKKKKKKNTSQSTNKKMRIPTCVLNKKTSDRKKINLAECKA